MTKRVIFLGNIVDREQFVREILGEKKETDIDKDVLVPPRKGEYTIFVQDKSELVNEIKISLANFYSIERPIEDSEVVSLLERLQNENARYLTTLTTINRALKNGHNGRW